MIEYTVNVYPNGFKCWYLNGKRHREDGPAIEGKRWLNGSYTEKMACYRGLMAISLGIAR